MTRRQIALSSTTSTFISERLLRVFALLSPDEASPFCCGVLEKASSLCGDVLEALGVWKFVAVLLLVPVIAL